MVKRMRKIRQLDGKEKCVFKPRVRVLLYFKSLPEVGRAKPFDLSNGQPPLRVRNKKKQLRT